MTDTTLAAVLWDMDGTLIDSEPLWLEAELAMLERFGIQMTTETHDALIGSGLWEAAEHFRELGVRMEADDIVAEWVAHVERGIELHGAAWRPGAVPLLASLAEMGVPTALVTMSVRSLAETVARALPVGSFSAIIAGDEVQHSKPHPQPYLLGAAALGVPIEQCLAFEDSPTGLRSAVASGAVSIGIPNLLPLDTVPSHALWRTLEGIDAASLAGSFALLRNEAPSLSAVTDAIGDPS